MSGIIRNRKWGYKMKVTIKDIAMEAGVSPSSVSLVLNGRECRISAETQKKILDIAQEKGYKIPKERKRKNHSDHKIIGVIYQDFENFIHIEAMRGIETQASIYGFNVISCNGGNTTEKSLEYIEIMSGIGVSGIILMPPLDMNTNENNILLGNALKNSGVHFLLLDQAIQDLFCDFVTSDNKTGACMAVEYLIENGHTDIGLIAGTKGVYTTRKRIEGYREALELHGLQFDESRVYWGDYKKESGYLAAEYFEKLGVRAIFSMNDAMALGVYQYAQEHSIIIGEELSIVGFDYSEECVEVIPALTSVRQEGFMMGKKACEMIVGRITENDKDPHKTNYYVPKLIKKQSVKSK